MLKATIRIQNGFLDLDANPGEFRERRRLGERVPPITTLTMSRRQGDLQLGCCRLTL